MLFNPGVSSCVICSKCPLAERPPGPNTLLLIYEGYPLTQGKPTKEKKSHLFGLCLWENILVLIYLLTRREPSKDKKSDYLGRVCGRMQRFTASMFFHSVGTKSRLFPDSRSGNQNSGFVPPVMPSQKMFTTVELEMYPRPHENHFNRGGIYNLGSTFHI